MSIYDREPGILERVPADALETFRSSRSFEGLVVDTLEGTEQHDRILSQAAQDAAGDGPPQLEDAWAQTVGVAESTVAEQHGAADDGVASTLIDRTGGAEAQRQTVLPHIPQPDAPIIGDYTDPPRPEGLAPGEGPEAPPHNV